jgi:hypothetical protein
MDLYPPTNCRVTRHFETTPNQQHGQPAEIRPNTAIPTHHPNTRLAKATQGHKLYSKVLTISPNRLHKNSDNLRSGGRSQWQPVRK